MAPSPTPLRSGGRPEQRRSWPEQLAQIERRLRQPRLPDGERAALAHELIRLGSPRAARAALKGGAGPAIDRAAAFAADLEAGAPVLRQASFIAPADAPDLLHEARGTGALLAWRPGADRLTVVFAGTAREFAVPEPLIDDRGTHLLLARDLSRCFHLMGVPRLGADLGACLDTLRRLAAAAAPARPMLIGTSAGGYAALRYALELGAPPVLAFSAPTTLDLASDPGATLADYPQLEQLYQHGRALGIDLLPRYRVAQPEPRAMLCYSTGQRRDRAMAERMRGVPGVVLCPQPAEVGHTVFAWMNGTARMAELLQSFTALA